MLRKIAENIFELYAFFGFVVIPSSVINVNIGFIKVATVLSVDWVTTKTLPESKQKWW